MSRLDNDRDIEAQTEYELQVERNRREYEAYLQEVPQLKQIMNDFVTACLATKPEDVRAFATHYFSKFQAPTDE